MLRRRYKAFVIARSDIGINARCRIAIAEGNSDGQFFYATWTREDAPRIGSQLEIVVREPTPDAEEENG